MTELTGSGTSTSTPAGATTLIGGPGRDDLIGALNGNTTVSYDETWRDKPVRVALTYRSFQEGSPETQSVDENGEKNENDLLNGMINGVIGGPKDDLLIGNLMNNTFDGGPGADTIAGLKGKGHRPLRESFRADHRPRRHDLGRGGPRPASKTTSA